MGRETLVVFRNLLAEIFLFHFEKGFRILLFESGDKKAEKSADEVADAFEHFSKLGWSESTDRVRSGTQQCCMRVKESKSGKLQARASQGGDGGMGS